MRDVTHEQSGKVSGSSVRSDRDKSKPWARLPTSQPISALPGEEGGFTGLKLRLGRERGRDDVATIEAVRKAVGEDMALMVDFNQGLHLGEALQRCHIIDDLGLAWIEEPIVYDNMQGFAQLTAELKVAPCFPGSHANRWWSETKREPSPRRESQELSTFEAASSKTVPTRTTYTRLLSAFKAS